MFNLFNLPPRRECFIEDSVLFVKDIFEEDYHKIYISPTKFFEEHKHITDVAQDMPSYMRVLFKVEDSEGNIVIGFTDGIVNVVNNGRVISYTYFDNSEIMYPRLVGYHREKSELHDTFVDLWNPQALLVQNSEYYAKFEKPYVPEGDPELLISVALASAKRCNLNVADMYFIGNYAEDMGIVEHHSQKCIHRGTSPVWGKETT